MVQGQYKELLAKIPVPVTVVCTNTPEGPWGATISSFVALSLDPPLVSIALINGNSLLTNIQSERRFSINILSQTQADVAMGFAGKPETRFSGVNWDWSAGLPKLAGTAAYLECELFEEIGAGDHTLAVGKVNAYESGEEPPLIYCARQFGGHDKLTNNK